MNELQTLQERVNNQIPGATSKIDKPLRPDGHWFLDVSLGGKTANVSWGSEGFGLCTCPNSDHGFGEGPDEITQDLEAALGNIIKQLE